VSKTQDVAGEWRRLHIEEHYDLHSSLNIIRVIKSKMNEMGESCGTNGREGFSQGKFLREIKYSGVLGVGGRIILKWLFKNRTGRD